VWRIYGGRVFRIDTALPKNLDRRVSTCLPCVERVGRAFLSQRNWSSTMMSVSVWSFRSYFFFAWTERPTGDWCWSFRSSAVWTTCKASRNTGHPVSTRLSCASFPRRRSFSRPVWWHHGCFQGSQSRVPQNIESPRVRQDHGSPWDFDTFTCQDEGVVEMERSIDDLISEVKRERGD
jgi:hypothetical protein